jgi:flagellar biosynthesis protein FliP
MAFATSVVAWLPANAMAQSLSLNLGANGNGSLASSLVSIVAITSVLAIAPGILVMGTSFTRLVVVLSMLRTALGLQQTPPNSVIIALALFLTGFIMAPAFETAYREAVQPLVDGTITEEQALDRGTQPFRNFMTANTSAKDIVLFRDLAGLKAPDAPKAGEEVPLRVLCSAFLVSELSKAFQIGFLLFLPFLVIDIVVSSILMGMGMMMLPPVVVSLPFKLIFFVLVSGWEMVAGSLVRSFVA